MNQNPLPPWIGRPLATLSELGLSPRVVLTFGLMLLFTLALMGGSLWWSWQEEEAIGHHVAVLVAGTSALLLGLMSAVTLWRGILRSLEGPVAFAERIAAGDLSARASVLEGGEFGRLADALNRMADTLQQSEGELRTLNAELEQRIAQRTLLVRAANRGLTESSREMALLADLSQAMLASEGCAEAHRAIAAFFEQIFPAGAGRLYVRRGDTESFDSMAEWGRPAFVATLTVPACRALRERRPLCACADPGATCQSPPPMFSPGSSALCLPLIAWNETFGMIYLELPATGGVSGKCIDPAAKRLATIVGRQVAVGLTNLRLREALREQSIRDALTGLYNRRYLDETLAREIERVRRKAGRLSAIMLDVDHFKRFNDTWGHEAGDVVLAAVGRLLRDNVRTSDVPCRFGGEEFTVLLPDADAALAAERAELLRRAAGELRLEFGGKPLPGVTISLGVAELPLQSDTGADLLAAADSALYRAKQGGRDRVEIAHQTEITRS